MKHEEPRYTHEERVEFFQQAADDYYKKEISIPPPLNWDFMHEEISKKKSNRIKRFTAIAATIILVCITGNIISAVASNDTAYGDKGILHRIYQSIKGLGTDKQDEINDNDILDTFEINSMSEIDKAIKFSDGALYVPNYIPSGYELNSLKMESMSLKDFTATYEFIKGKEEVLNIVEMHFSGDGQASASGNGELIKLKDRSIYLQDRDEDGYLYAAVYMEDAMIQIRAKVSRKKILNIAKNLSTTVK